MNQLDQLRAQLRAKAAADPRFKGDGKSPGAWICELNADGGAPCVILQVATGKFFEVPFTVANGDVTLAASSREMFRSVRYLPRAAEETDIAPVPLQARDFSSAVQLDQPWMFAPGGTHTINCGAGQGGSAEVTLKVDAETATVLNARLVAINSRNAPHRAFIDKEHDEAAGAVAWPEKLFWSESPQPGIYVAHQATDLGKELVGGKVIRAFSPSFYSDAALPKKVGPGQHVKIAAGKRGSPENPARMTDLVFPACGTITNNPAFRKILPLWAKNAPGAK